MKRESIIEALEKAGVQLEDDKLKTFIKDIQVANGYDIERAKSDYDAKINELADLQNKYDAEIKSHEKGGDKYVDETELNELRKFKVDTLNAQNKSQQNENIVKFLTDNKFDKKAINLLSMVARDKGAKFNDKNELENPDDFLKTMTNEFSDYLVTETMQGANPQVKTSDSNCDDAFIKGFKGEK